MAIALLLGHIHSVIQARTMRRDFEEQWPLPQAGPLYQDNYDDNVSEVNLMENTDDMNSSVTSEPTSTTSSSLYEDIGSDLLLPSSPVPLLARGPTTRTCVHCDETGHFARDCPNRDPNNPFRVTFPTASQQLLRLDFDGSHPLYEALVAQRVRTLMSMQFRNCNQYGHFAQNCILNDTYE
jgi:hypothetical protein